MPFALLKYGLRKTYPANHHFTPAATELKKHYDVVIIGAGGHGTSIAYYLAKHHGVTNVAVFDKGYLGGGNTARNTAVIRSNYLTEEGVTFYRESVKLFQDMSNELGFNVMMENRGQLTLAIARYSDRLVFANLVTFRPPHRQRPIPGMPRLIDKLARSPIHRANPDDILCIVGKSV